MEFTERVEESPEYNLKWNSHHSTLVSVLDSLLKRESLTDVTLAAEGQFVNVHRIVLFACSTYFEELLSQQPKKQAIIFLKDVSFANLTALIHFMYRGEVQVSEDQLPSFMQTAEALHIKGLLVFDQEAKKTTPQQKNHTGKIKSSKGKSTANTRTKTTSPERRNMPVSPPASVHSLSEKSSYLVTNPSSLTVIPVEALENLAEINKPVELEELRCMGKEFYDTTSPRHATSLKQETPETEDNSEKHEIYLPRHHEGNNDEDDDEEISFSVFQQEIPLNNNTLGTTIQPSSSSSTENPRPAQAQTISKSSRYSARRRHVNYSKPQPGKKGCYNERLSSVVYACVGCGRNFMKETSLTRHIVRLECDKPPTVFQCPLCSYSSHYPANLRRHVGTKHNN